MPARRVESIASAVTMAAMVAVPFGGRRSSWRRRLTTAVVTSGFTSTVAASARAFGARRTAVAAVASLAGTTAIEAFGVRTGRPFGRYRYTDALRPRITRSAVPVVVPMAWTAMAFPAREVAHAALGERSTRLRRITVGAAALTAWDLFLDPQMTGEGFWEWKRVGRYRGVPLTNFAGWFGTAIVIMAMLEVAVPAVQPDAGLVARYGVVCAMEAAAFASFLDDRLVAATGGVAMLPVAVLATRRLVGQRA